MKKNGKPEPLDFHVLIEKEGRLYSALCLELDVASQGRTIAETKKNILEAIELYLESVYDDGDEKEFIPRPAPIEELLKYFEHAML
ncbi:MAG: type II toxin-antitoxin system HicB family antitoxin [bacterium]